MENNINNSTIHTKDVEEKPVNGTSDIANLLAQFIDANLVTSDVIDFAKEMFTCIELYARKNYDYGNSFEKGMQIIGPAYGIGRIYDKTNRIINIFNKDITAVSNETVYDTVRDLTCYSVMLNVFWNKIRLAMKDTIKFD